MSSDFVGSSFIPMEARRDSMSRKDCLRADVVSSVSAPIARKLTSSMYERVVVGYRSNGERDGNSARALMTVDE